MTEMTDQATITIRLFEAAPAGGVGWSRGAPFFLAWGRLHRCQCHPRCSQGPQPTPTGEVRQGTCLPPVQLKFPSVINSDSPLNDWIGVTPPLTEDFRFFYPFPKNKMLWKTRIATSAVVVDRTTYREGMRKQMRRQKTKEEKEAEEMWEKKVEQNQQALKSGDH